MIAFPKSFRQKSVVKSKPAWHAGFMALLPDIRRQVRFAFRRLEPERREEAVQEAIANALVAYVRLHELGRTNVAFATPLASFAVKQVRAGRRVGGALNSQDVLSPYAQRQQGFTVSRLHQADESEGTWREVLVEDRSCNPSALATIRLDFGAWIKKLPRHKRRIASTLAKGETTSDTAKKFRVTAGRISQLRRELAESWDEFHGEPEQGVVATR